MDIYRDIVIGMFSATVQIEWLTHRESPKELMFSFPKLKFLSIFSRERERERERERGREGEEETVLCAYLPG